MVVWQLQQAGSMGVCPHQCNVGIGAERDPCATRLGLFVGMWLHRGGALDWQLNGTVCILCLCVLPHQPTLVVIRAKKHHPHATPHSPAVVGLAAWERGVP